MKVKSESEVAKVVSISLLPCGLQPTRLLRLWDFPGKSTGVGCHCLLHVCLEEQTKLLEKKATLRVLEVSDESRFLGADSL